MSLDHSLAFASVALALFFAGPSSASAQVDFGAAKPFVVLAGSAVTNTGPTVVTGSVGSSPGSAVVGFPPGIVIGAIHAADTASQQAQTDLTTAYNTLAGLPSQFNLTGQDLGGKTLVPAVYTFTTAAQLTGALALDAQGNDDAVFIFQIGSTLTTASTSTVTLTNGGFASNVFWQVGSSATLGSTSAFVGNIVALTSVTLNTGATLDGRALGRNGAVTMDTNSITFPAAPICGAIPGQKTSRDSVSSAGVQGNDHSRAPSMSSTGRFVAFGSAATNLITGDTNAALDVFVRNRKTHAMTLISRASDGTLGAGDSHDPSISDSGFLVAFWSSAANLTPGDANANDDVFVRNRKHEVTTLVSVASDGTPGNGQSLSPAISGDGRFVVFVSHATNLVAGDTNALPDVFVHDRKTHDTTRVSVGSAGTQANGGSSFAVSAISRTGRYVAFQSDATNIAPNSPGGGVFIHDRDNGVTELVSAGGRGISISANGRYVGFESDATNLVIGDTNARTDVFVLDRALATTVRVSLDSLGVQGNDNSFAGTISRDGRRVAFFSDATNLVGCDGNGTTDAFLRVLKSGKTRRFSVATDGSESALAVDTAHSPALDAKGKHIAFGSISATLVAGDTNSMSDVFASTN